MEKRSLYISGGPHNWIQIAKELENSDGIRPVYWLGPPEKEESVKKQFTDTIFHSYRRALRGLQSQDVENNIGTTTTPIDKDTLDKYRKYTYTIFRAMDRVDPKYAFNYDERTRHYHKLLRYWITVFEKYDISMVIFPESPFHSYSYLIYAICSEKNIDRVIIRKTKIPNICYIRSDLDQGPHFLSDNHTNIDEYTLSEATEEYYLNQLESGDRHTTNTDRGFLDLLYNMSNIRDYLKKMFKKSGSYYKKPHKLMENNEVTWIEYIFHKYRMSIRKNRLKNHYKKVSEKPNFDEEYVYVPLHYQPERTTVPEGDVYSTQNLFITLLRDVLPDEYYIYVKEHPVQFNTFKQGEHCRSRYHYDDLLSLKNIRLIDMDVDINTLIDNSLAIATLTGTTAWEGAFRDTPSLMFGTAWYAGCPGIYDVKTEAETADAIEKIINGTKVEKSKIKEYMKIMEKNGFQSYSINTRFSNDMPKEEKVKNTQEAISNYIENNIE